MQFDKEFSLKANSFASEQGLQKISYYKISQKPFLIVDNQGPIPLDTNILKKFNLIKHHLYQKVDYRRCFPVMRRLLQKVYCEESGDCFEDDFCEEEGQFIPTKFFGSINTPSKDEGFPNQKE